MTRSAPLNTRFETRNPVLIRRFPTGNSPKVYSSAVPALEREALEEQLRDLHRREDYPGVAARLVEGYGAEILGYLAAILRDDDAGQDAFQAMCEDILEGLPAFRGEASFRTWLYTVARHRALKVNRQARRGAVPLSQSPEVAHLVNVARSATAPYLRTETKASVRRLREQLTEEEQTLLILRVDRGMDWLDIARVFAESHEEDVGKLAARLRKRFQRTKERLQKLAQREGLLG